MLYSRSGEEDLNLVTPVDSRNIVDPYSGIKIPTGYPLLIQERVLDRLHERDLSVNQLMKIMGITDRDIFMDLMGGWEEYVKVYRKGNKTMFGLTKEGKDLVEFWRSSSWYRNESYLEDLLRDE